MAGPKLTKTAIIESLHEKHGLNRADIHKIIDEFFEEVKEGLKNDQVIELRGFGTFEYAPARAGRKHATQDRRNCCR
jgi:integration host factor subunit beta